MHPWLPATGLGLPFALPAFAQHPPQGTSRTLSLAESEPSFARLAVTTE